MADCCEAFNNAVKKEAFDPLLLIPLFILDFLCIHPFNDGNGRMSRLLTLLLTYRAGYIVGKYISIERLIEQTKEQYYEVLHASSQGWIDGKNDYMPFIRYFLGILVKAYNEFEERVSHLKFGKISKPERIKKIIENKIGKFNKQDIRDLCPDISIQTIEKTLIELVKQGEIIKIGNGRYAGYARR